MYLPLKKAQAYTFNKSSKIPKHLIIQIKKLQMLSKGYLQILKNIDVINLYFQNLKIIHQMLYYFVKIS